MSLHFQLQIEERLHSIDRDAARLDHVHHGTSRIGGSLLGRCDLIQTIVTGVSGFIGQHVAHAYLQRDFTVRGTARSEAKGAGIRAIFDREFPGKFELAIVDIEKPEELDAAARGVDGIAHVASPITVLPPGGDPQELIGPAVNGTLNVLKSAAKAGTVKRVVITGSTGSIVQPRDPPYTYSARDWNDYAVEQVEKLGREAPPQYKYQASKTLAERAANAWVEENKPAFDVSHILPYWVYGPIIENYSSVDKMFATPRLLLSIFQQPKRGAELSISHGGFIHVYDVARAHVDAHTREEVGVSGSRLILSCRSAIVFQDYYDAYWSLPDSERPKLPFEVTKGEPERVRGHRFTYETAEDLLGWDFKSLAVTVRDSLGDAVRKLYSTSNGS